MNMKYKILLCVGLLLLAFASGRYSVNPPDATTKIDQKIDTQVQDDKDTKTHTVTVIVKEPTGETKTTTTTDTSVIDKEVERQVSDTQIQQEIKSVTKRTINVSVLGGFDKRTNLPTYGAAISREILGPITIGVWGLNNGSFGANIGLDF